MNSSPLRSQKLLKHVKASVVVAKKLDHGLDCYINLLTLQRCKCTNSALVVRIGKGKWKSYADLDVCSSRPQVCHRDAPVLVQKLLYLCYVVYYDCVAVTAILQMGRARPCGKWMLALKTRQPGHHCTYVCSKGNCGLASGRLVLHPHNRLRKQLDSSLTQMGPFAVTQLAAPRTTHMLVQIAVLAGPCSNTAYFCCNSTSLMTTCSARGRSRCKSKGLLSSQVVIAPVVLAPALGLAVSAFWAAPGPLAPRPL